MTTKKEIEIIRKITIKYYITNKTHAMTSDNLLRILAKTYNDDSYDETGKVIPRHNYHGGSSHYADTYSIIKTCDIKNGKCESSFITTGFTNQYGGKEREEYVIREMITEAFKDVFDIDDEPLQWLLPSISIKTKIFLHDSKKGA